MKTYRLLEIKQTGQLTYYKIERKTWFGWINNSCFTGSDYYNYYTEAAAIKEYERLIGKNSRKETTLLLTNENLLV